MSTKPVSLTAHKSNIERTRRKTVKQDMQATVRNMSNNGNIVAYAIVGLSDDGRAFAGWDTGGLLPMWAFPDTVCNVLRCDIAESEVDEDFRRPLLDRAWKGSK